MGDESRCKFRLYVVDFQSIQSCTMYTYECGSSQFNLGEGEGVGAKLNRLQIKLLSFFYPTNVN